MRSFEELEAWRLAHRLTLAIYKATQHWPTAERFALISQARRAAFSVAVNIAEGSAKRGPSEFRRFLDISLGSLSELRYILLLARDLQYLALPEFEVLDRRRDEVGKVLWALYRAVSASVGR
jgi:four helix bundle protein